jgi:hypothetical protein
MKIPTDSRLLKVLQEFNQQQELESMKNEGKHSTREKDKDKDKDKEKERGKDKDREKRKTRHRRARDEISEDIKNSDHSNDSVSETSDDTNKLVLDSDEVQSFFQMNA